jgi:predicted aspartyl protease
MPNSKKTRVRLEIHSVDDGWHICLPIRMNGIPCTMLLDTGASRTVLDLNSTFLYTSEKPQLIENKLSAGLGTTDMQSYSLQLNSMQIGKIELNNYECIVLDLNVLNSSYEMLGINKVVGIIGTDLLLQFNATLNLSARTLTLNSSQGVI